jgi:hypothetical protein
MTVKLLEGLEDPIVLLFMFTAKNISSALLAAITLISTPIAASANEWVLVSYEDNGAKLFLDLDSISRNGQITSASTLVIFRQNSSDNHVGYTNASEFLCDEMKSRSTGSIYMAWDGSTTPSSGSEKWTSLPVGSVGRVLAERVCRYQKQ